jgi:hypothetical protein
MLPLVESWAGCPACAVETPRRALHVVRNRKAALVAGPYYAVIGCDRCGLVYMSPRPTPEALDRFYVDDERDGWTVRHDGQGRRRRERKKRSSRSGRWRRFWQSRSAAAPSISAAAPATCSMY